MAPSQRVRFVHTRDHERLAVTELGSGGEGPAFLLVHGFGQNRRSFTEGPLPTELLARGARVFAGELRGHGHNRIGLDGERHDIAHKTLEIHLDYDLPAILGHVQRVAGVDRVHYMGHSMGGLLGYALLGLGAPLASMTGWAAPLCLGADRTLLRLASRVAKPMLGRRAALPIGGVLGAVAGVLTRHHEGGLRGMVHRRIGLANAHKAPRHTLQAVLRDGEEEGQAVFRDLAALLGKRRPVLCGVDLVEAAHAYEGPLAAVVGEYDIFASPASVSELYTLEQSGPRKVVCIRDAHHVDVPLGYHVPQVVEALYPGLVQTKKNQPGGWF